MKADVIKLVDPSLNESLKGQMIAVVNAEGAQVSIPRIDNHPDSRGLIVLSPNNPEWASMVAVSRTFDWQASGLSRFVDRQVTMRYTVKMLREIIKNFDLKVGDDLSVKVRPSRLIVKEQLTPFFVGQQPKMNPQTGCILVSGTSPIYRRTISVDVASPEIDTFIQHTGEGVSLEAFVAQSALDSKETVAETVTAPVVADATVTN